MSAPHDALAPDRTLAPDAQALDRLISERLDALLPQKLAELHAKRTPAMTIIATKGTLDWAYPPFILASTAAALGWKVSMFFTFYGLTLLKKNLKGLKVSPLGNPGMPMKMPFGSDRFRSLDWKIPNLLQGNMPGFEAMATRLMKQTIKNKGVASITELRDACIEGGVNLIGCQMTVDLFGFKYADFIPEVSEYCGAATFLAIAKDADVNLFV